MDESYLISFITNSLPGIETVYNCCLNHGLTPKKKGGTDKIERYRIGLDLHEDADSEIALSKMEKSDEKTLYLWSESSMRLALSIDDNMIEYDRWFGGFRISFQTTEIDYRHQSGPVIETRLDEVFDLVLSLIPIVDPEYVWSAIYDENEHYDAVKPTGRPIAKNIREPSWITVISPEIIDQFGGRDHVLSTPAYRVEEIDTGHIALMCYNHPYDQDPDAQGNWKRHLMRAV